MNNVSMIRFTLVLIGIFLLTSCGPVVLTARSGNPPPPWFYPNRLEVVRYVYFPEISIYYDLSARTYVYFDGGVWVRGNILPPRYRSIDLSRYRYERIRNYKDDNIRRYHEEYNTNSRRSNKTARRTKR